MNASISRRLSAATALLITFMLAFLLGEASLPAQSAGRAAAVGALKDGSYENYDVRDTEGTQAAKAAAVRSGYRAKQLTGARVAKRDALAADMARARGDLAARIPTLQTENNPFGTAPEIVGTVDAKAFLTTASTASHEAILRNFLATNAAVYGLAPVEAASLTKFADYANPAGNLSWVGLKQEINGLPVFQSELQAAFTPDGSLARTTSSLAVGLEAASLPTVPALTPSQAAAKAAAAVGYDVDASKFKVNSTEQHNRVTYLSFGPFVKETRTEQIYFPLEPGVATLAYSMVLWENIRAYYVIVDANDGTLLWRKNITQDQSQTATYNVYTGVSPSPLTPSPALPGQGYQPPGVGRVDVALVADDLNASPLGWITDSAGGASVPTTGNNCDAGLDAAAPNGIDASTTTTSGGVTTVTTYGSRPTTTNRIFSFAYNPVPLGTEPASSYTTTSSTVGSTTTVTNTITPYGAGTVTNLFFWTNRYHDAVYNLGFTEAARNFQTTNTFTINGISTNRGGSAGDPVLAEVHDYGSTNNANFSTPADGGSGRMQMYIFTGPTPTRDGSLDADVFIHEMTHGLSNRLHNNGSGLTSQQAGGMGEGWSDYYARCLLSRADEDVNAVFPSGGYVTYRLSSTFTDNYYYGIRPFPYAVKANVGANGKPHDPETFGVLDLLTINGLSNGAYPSSPVIGITANEVHNVGVFWCTTLLEMRARLINRLGYAVGNQRALQIVTDGMKLDGTNPTIVVARDSLIAADNAAYAGDDVPDIRSAFATRGVGAGASTTGATLFTIVESFFPSSVPGAVTFSDSLGNGDGVANPGEDLVFTVPLTNRLNTMDAGVTVTLGNVTASYGSLGAGASASRTFAYHVPAATAPGTTLQIPLAVTSPNGTGTVQVPVLVGTPIYNAVLAEAFDGVTVPALPTGWTQTGTVTNSNWRTVSTPVIDSGFSAFAADVASASDSSLVSPTFDGVANQQVSFKHRYTLETGYDAGVLEIKIGASGAFTDLITAGGSWVQGGYGFNIGSAATSNPLIGRRAWSGTIAATSTVIANLPASVAGQPVQLRWRLGCDSSTAGTGWYVDSVQVYRVTSYNSTPIDADGDGIPDGYERLYGLNPSDPTDAAGDLDGDGVSNRDEYLAGTDPLNAASRLGLSASAYSPANGLTLSFPTVTGKTYQLDYKNDLTDPGWTTLPGTYDGTGGTLNLQYSPADLNNQPKRFYRLRVYATRP